MAQRVQLISANPSKKKNPKKGRRKNPDVKILGQTAALPSANEAVGALAGGIMAMAIPGVVNRLPLPNLPAIVGVGVGWLINGFLGVFVRRQVGVAQGTAYILGSSAIHAMQAADALTAGRFGIPTTQRAGFSLPGAAGVRAAPRAALAPARNSVAGTVTQPSAEATGGRRRHMSVT